MRNGFSQQEQEGTFPVTRWLVIGIVVVLVGLALIPYGWFPFWKIFKYAPELGWRIQMLFDSNAAHIIGHTSIFMMIGTAVLLWFPSLINRPKVYLSIMFVLGFLQEVFQLIGFKHRAPVLDDFLDVVVDLIGAGLALLLMRFIWKKPGKAPTENE
jgi:hypothetical protein